MMTNPHKSLKEETTSMCRDKKEKKPIKGILNEKPVELSDNDKKYVFKV